MGQLIFDSTIWINFFNNSLGKPEDLLQEKLNIGEYIISCPTIIQEVLQGIRRDNEFIKIRHLLLATHILNEDYLTTSLGAVDIYRSLRKKGITIRKPNDCLIAWYAIHHELTLVHNDRDFDLIAEHTPLKTYQPG